MLSRYYAATNKSSSDELYASDTSSNTSNTVELRIHA